MIVSSINGVGKVGYPLMKKKEIWALIPYTIINSKSIFNVTVFF